MTKITPNRNALKELSDLNIDSSFIQRYGNQVFAYDGDVTESFATMCQQLLETTNDAIIELQSIQKAIPPVNNKA